MPKSFKCYFCTVFVKCGIRLTENDAQHQLKTCHIHQKELVL